MAVDGSLIFNTKMDTSGFDKGVKELSSKVLELKNKLKSTETQISSLQEELENLSNTEVKTKISEQIEKDAARAKEKLNSFYAEADKIGDAKKNELVSMGFGTEHLDNILAQDKNWQKVQSDIENAEKALNQYESELKRVRAAESKIDPKSTADYKAKEERLSELTRQLEIYKTKLRETEKKESTATNKTKKAANSFDRFKKSVSKAGKGLASAFKSGAVNLIKKIGSHAKKSASEMGGLSKAFNPIKQALQGMIIYQGISKIFDSIKDGMQNLARASPETNASLSILMTSLIYLKNTLATAFEPILNIVAPILSHFINILALVTDKIAQFMSALTGNGVYKKSVKVQQDYADSIADSTSAVEDNTKAAEENQKSIAGYDDLNVMQDNSTSDKAKGSKNEIAPSDMFTTATVSNGINGFANQLKSLFEAQDFKGIGKLIGDKINGALSNINWNKICSTSKKWAHNIAEFLNGAISGIDWNLVGTTIGNGLMVAFGFLYTFFTTFGFQSFGSDMANIIIGFFNSINWTTIGGTFGAILQSIIFTGFGFVTEMDKQNGWETIGNDLSNIVNGFFSKINWKMAAQTISNGLKGLLSTIRTFFAETNWEQIGNDIGTFIANIDWLGILMKILQAIGSIFSAATDIIKGVIQKCPLLAFPLAPFLGLILIGDLLQGDFGILKWAGDLWNNVKNTICSVFAPIGDFFAGVWDGIKNTFGSVANWFKNVFSAAWQAVKNVFSAGGRIFEGIKESLSNVFTNVVNGLIDGINWVIAKPFEGINWALDRIKNVEIVGWKPFDWIQPLDIPQIPKLATGTVVPANYGEFLAVLGDNKREAEIVSPISAMKQAMSEVLAEFGSFGGNGDINLTINLDGEPIFRDVIKRNNAHKKRHGVGAFG